MWYTTRMASTHDSIFAWLDSMRGTRMIKILSGIRGVGKSRLLGEWRTRLLESGVPEERIIYIDAEEPVLRHLVTGEQVIAYLKTQIPQEGDSFLFIDEPSSFPDYENGFGEMLRMSGIDIYVSISSRRLLTGGLSSYLRGVVRVREIMPPPKGIRETDERSRARWNEIILRDVLSDPHITSASLAEAIASYLSDSVGDPISLRSIAAAVSPPGKLISPNTADAYLTALCNAHIVEKCMRWNAELEEVQKTGYRVFFTDPALRRARFGFAPVDEDARVAMNRRWLEARSKTRRVLLPEQVDYDSPFIRA